MCDAVADLTARARLFDLIFAALNGAAKNNPDLQAALRPITQEVRWRQLRTAGLVLRLGPFVNRSHLRDEVEKLFLSRRLLRVSGTAHGRTWSCQMIERVATLHGARYIHKDMRKVPVEGRTNPKWLATKLHEELFTPPAVPPSLEGFTENRLVEPLLKAWVVPTDVVLIALDHLRDQNVASSVHDYVAALAVAIAEEKLPRVKLILIDGPETLDLSDYEMQLCSDVVETLSIDHLRTFFCEAASALYPFLKPAERQPIIEAAASPIIQMASAGINAGLAIHIRDALETMAMELHQ
jgi:hypothetical protein